MKKVIGLSFLIVNILISPTPSIAAEEVTLYSSKTEEVTLYSSRTEALIKPLLDRFTQETAISVNLVTQKAKPLITRLQQEGINSPADLFLTVDAGRLQRANELGLLQAIKSDKLNTVIPDEFRHPAGFWYGLSVRARPIFYAKSKVKAEELSTYEALADDKWKNRICVRSAKNIYNQSLVASMISHHGVENTQIWAKKLVANMARKPKGGDRDQIKAAALGNCDIAIANTYYYGAMIHNENEKKLADEMAIFWPNQKDRGTHVNITGIGMTKSSKNKENAQLLMEYLATQESQNWYAQINHEYPVIITGEWSGTLKGWGYFNFDPINTAKFGEFNQEAIELMDRAGWD